MNQRLRRYFEILDDARKLMHQEAQLVRVEVRQEGVKMRQALTYVIAGSTALFVAIVLFAFMFVQIVATEWFQTPLWAAFGIVACISSAVGAVSAYIGAKKLQDIRVSSEQSLKALREGFGWMQRTM